MCWKLGPVVRQAGKVKGDHPAIPVKSIAWSLMAEPAPSSGVEYFYSIPADLRRLLLRFVHWTVLRHTCGISAIKHTRDDPKIWREMYRENFSEKRPPGAKFGRNDYLNLVDLYFPLINPVEPLLARSADYADNALVKASEAGLEKIVVLLVSGPIDIHAHHDAALRDSSSSGYLDIVRCLVEHGADIHAHYDAALKNSSSQGHLEVVRYLIAQGADIHAHNSYCLYEASCNGHNEVVKFLVECGGNVNILDDAPLRLACERGELDMVKYLLEHGANIHAQDDQPLITACWNGHLPVVKFLVKMGARVSIRNNEPIKTAMEQKQFPVAKFLRQFLPGIPPPKCGQQTRAAAGKQRIQQRR